MKKNYKNYKIDKFQKPFHGSGQKKKKVGFIHIKCTKNNTIITLTDLQGNTLYWVSCGSLGFKNSRKSTTYAAQAASEKIAFRTLKLGFNSVYVYVKGLGFGKESSIRALYKSGITLLKIKDCTSIAHNGCRASKQRRV